MIETINRRLAKKNSRLTQRGEYFVLVSMALGILLISFVIGFLMRDVCYVGLEHGNAIGYGSCQEQIDRFWKETNGN